MTAMEKLRMMAEQKKANILNTGVDPNGNPVPQITVDMTGVNTNPSVEESQYISFRSPRAAGNAWDRAQKELGAVWPSKSEAFDSWRKNFLLGNPGQRPG